MFSQPLYDLYLTTLNTFLLQLPLVDANIYYIITCKHFKRIVIKYTHVLKRTVNDFREIFAPTTLQQLPFQARLQFDKLYMLVVHAAPRQLALVEKGQRRALRIDVYELLHVGLVQVLHLRLPFVSGDHVVFVKQWLKVDPQVLAGRDLAHLVLGCEGQEWPRVLLLVLHVPDFGLEDE